MMREIDYDRQDPCEVPNCGELADFLVYSRGMKGVVKCCEKHATAIVQEQYPEYVVCCDNCDCMLPVN
jgi:hypothetical protein